MKEGQPIYKGVNYNGTIYLVVVFNDSFGYRLVWVVEFSSKVSEIEKKKYSVEISPEEGSTFKVMF